MKGNNLNVDTCTDFFFFFLEFTQTHTPLSSSLATLVSCACCSSKHLTIWPTALGQDHCFLHRNNPPHQLIPEGNRSF